MEYYSVCACVVCRVSPAPRQARKLWSIWGRELLPKYTPGIKPHIRCFTLELPLVLLTAFPTVQPCLLVLQMNKSRVSCAGELPKWTAAWHHWQDAFKRLPLKPAFFSRCHKADYITVLILSFLIRRIISRDLKSAPSGGKAYETRYWQDSEVVYHR